MTDFYLADLRDAEGLEASAIRSSRNWEHALYGEELRKELGLAADHNERVHEELKWALKGGE